MHAETMRSQLSIIRESQVLASNLFANVVVSLIMFPELCYIGEDLPLRHARLRVLLLSPQLLTHITKVVFHPIVFVQRILII